MKLSEHFDTGKDVHFNCRCCGKFIHVPRLIEELECIQFFVGHPININSGTRCPAHNESLSGSVQNSYHLTGEAVHIWVEGLSSYTLYLLLCELYPKSKGVGVYRDYVHFDIGPYRRWSA